jgi:nitronate monooxygenase
MSGRAEPLVTLVERLRLPVIAAPMFLVSGVELVLGACRAGVIGSFPAPNARTIEELDAWCRQIAGGLGDGDAPWALNVVAHRTYTRLEEECEVLAVHRPPLVITALGSPERLIDTVRGYGGLVLADVSLIKHARKALDAGVDGLVLVCAGAGGHTGVYNPFAFTHEVRRFFDGPLVVSGGVSDGRAVAAVRALGADLAYVGTRFITTRESLVSDEYREMVVNCGLDDIVLTDSVTGIPANWMRPSLEAAGTTQSSAGGGAPDFASIMSGDRRRWRDIWSAGHGIAGAAHTGTVRELVDQLAAEYERVSATNGSGGV